MSGTKIDKLSLAQLFIVGLAGTSLTEREESFIKETNPGGVILFKNNYENPAQLAELSNKIQSLKSTHPFFISADQEGGRVQRFKEPFTVFPPMYEIAKLNSPKLCYEVHKTIAKELIACGINLNFSPCCDVLFNEKNTVIGDRSFGENPVEVEKYVSAAIRGLQTHGVISVAKHFPGHGSTIKDSHYDLPFIDATVDEIIEKELQPFKKASRSRVVGMMMAHLQIDSIDESAPTSLSKKAYVFLREQLKFQGLIITDDMEMGAISKNQGIPEACCQALIAGADLICIRNFDEGEKAIQLLQVKLANGELDEQIFSDKLARINNVKSQYLKDIKPIYIPQLTEVFDNEETQVLMVDLAQKIAEFKEG